MTPGCRTALATLATLIVMLSGTVATSAEERAVSFYNIHTKDSVTVVFKRDGEFDQDALKKLNWFLRDWRQDEPTDMDPRLFDLLWSMHKELGSSEPIHVISAYRSPKTNEMLRKTRGGQARKSQHTLGRAIDVHFPDVPVRTLRYSAMVREVGGVGYYPTSALPFVHVDTGRVRHWPRMKRDELALLFPDGKSRHVPADRQPLQAGDSLEARKSNPKLAITVAGFHELRKGGQGRVRDPLPIPGSPIEDWSTEVAAAVPRPATPPPQLLLAGIASDSASEPAAASGVSAVPKLARAGLIPSGGSITAAGTTEQRMLTRLAALALESDPARSKANRRKSGVVALAANDPRVPDEPEWSPGERVKKLPTIAPEFDEEHPDELSYRPFPIAPYLTATASSDDAALAKLFRPDAELTLAFMDYGGELPSTELVVGPSIAPYAATDTFRGAAVKFVSFLRPSGSAGETGSIEALISRRDR